MTTHDDERDRLFASIPPMDGYLIRCCDFCLRADYEPTMRDPQASLLILREVVDGLQICEGCWEKPEVKAQFSLSELRQAAGEKEKAA